MLDTNRLSHYNSGQMIDQILLARSIAEKAHAGQTDKLGLPYIEHCRRVAESFSETDWVERAAGWLHDTMEDCGMSREQLLYLGVGVQVGQVVECLTRRKSDETYDQYITRVAAGPIAARRVKIADLRDNRDRAPRLLEPDRSRLIRRYDAAIARIEKSL